MNVDVSERAFEDAIEAALIRPDIVVAEQRDSYDDMPSGVYSKRRSEDYDKTLCLTPRDVLDFVLATQPREWKRLSQHHGAMVEEQFLKRLASEIARRGALDVLRTGIRDMGCKFSLSYFRPASGLNDETRELHRANLFSVVRQLHYSEKNNNSLDMALFLNGIPIFTAELKNPLTGQTVEDAIRQYRTDPRAEGAAACARAVFSPFRRRPRSRLRDYRARRTRDALSALQQGQVRRRRQSAGSPNATRLSHVLSLGGDLGSGQRARPDSAVHPRVSRGGRTG